MRLMNSYPERHSSILAEFVVYLFTTEGTMWLRFVFIAMGIRWYLGALTVDQLLKEIICPDGSLLHQTYPTMVWNKFRSLVKYRIGTSKPNQKKQILRPPSPLCVHVQISQRSHIDFLLNKIAKKLGRDLMMVTFSVDLLRRATQSAWFSLFNSESLLYSGIQSCIFFVWPNQGHLKTESGNRVAIKKTKTENKVISSETMTSEHGKAKQTDSGEFLPRKVKKNHTTSKLIQVSVTVPDNEKSFNFTREEDRFTEDHECLQIPESVRAKYKEIREKLKWPETATKMTYKEFVSFFQKMNKSYIEFDFREEKNSIMKEELDCIEDMDEWEYAAYSTLEMTWYYLYMMDDGKNCSMLEQTQEELLLIESIEEGFQEIMSSIRATLLEEREEKRRQEAEVKRREEKEKQEEEERKCNEAEENRIKMEFKSFLSGDFDGVGIIEMPDEELKFETENNVNLENELRFLQEIDDMRIGQPNMKISKTNNFNQTWKKNKKTKNKRRR